MTYTFKATLQEEEDGRWSAWIESLPGCATWGYDRENALAMLQEAAELLIECMMEWGDPIPNDASGLPGLEADEVVNISA